MNGCYGNITHRSKMEWRETVTEFSANIFPDLSIPEPPFEFGTYKPSPSMPLQMFLFFNAHFFPFWTISSIIYLYLKFSSLGSLTKFLTIAVMIMVIFIECIRIYLGYLGNLSEQIPELAGFWMLSILLQFPLQTYLLCNPYLEPRPIELTLNSVMWLLILAELITGFYALKAAAARAKQYYTLKSHLYKSLQKDKVKEE